MLNAMPKAVRMMVSELMEERGISTAEMVEKANLSYPTVLRLQRGASRIDLETMARLCQVLCVEPGALFKLEETG